MKASSPATLLTRASLFSGLAAVLFAPVASGQTARQPTTNYRPPTLSYAPQRYPQAPAPAKAPTTSKKAPATAAAPPATYPPGYRYAPPPVKAPTTAKKKSGTTASSKSSSSSSKGSVAEKVSRLEKNDRKQDQRITQLEKTRPDGGGAVSGPMGSTYVVRKGDTLWRIAEKHNTSVNALRMANHLTGDSVSEGQALLIPSEEVSSQGVTASAFHIVKPGETFSRIASTYKVTQDALAAANPSAYPEKLLIGERLLIPGKKTVSATPGYTPTSPAAPAAPAPKQVVHVVKKGESLGAIAKKYGVSTTSLVSANKLKNPNVVDVGQKLNIPGKTTSSPAAPPPPPTYPGLAVADSDVTPLPLHNVTIPEVVPPSAPMASAPPAAASTPAPAPAPAPESRPISTPTASNRGVVAYRLERGDTVETVAAMFGTTPEKIRELNKLPVGKKLNEGDELVVPGIGAVSVN